MAIDNTGIPISENITDLLACHLALQARVKAAMSDSNDMRIGQVYLNLGKIQHLLMTCRVAVELMEKEKEKRDAQAAGK